MSLTRTPTLTLTLILNPDLYPYYQAIALAPKLVSARIDLGNFYRFVKRDYKKAAVQLKAAINLNPDDAVAHGGLAAIYADQGHS